MNSNPGPHITSPQPYLLSYQASPPDKPFFVAVSMGKRLKHIFQKLSPIGQRGKTGFPLFFVFLPLALVLLKSPTQSDDLVTKIHDIFFLICKVHVCLSVCFSNHANSVLFCMLFLLEQVIYDVCGFYGSENCNTGGY